MGEPTEAAWAGWKELRDSHKFKFKSHPATPLNKVIPAASTDALVASRAASRHLCAIASADTGWRDTRLCLANCLCMIRTSGSLLSKRSRTRT
eukprot:2406411-Rhodomonas_salina.1